MVLLPPPRNTTIIFLFVVILSNSHTVPGQCGQSSYLCEHEEGSITDVNK